MNDSILNSIKDMLGEYDDCFDSEIIMNINLSFMILNELGIGADNFRIDDSGSQVWDDFLQGFSDLEGVKNYVFYKTKILFDPPQSSFLMEAYDKILSELEWRLANKEEFRG